MENWIHKYVCDLTSDSGNTIDCGTLMVHGDSEAHTFKMEVMGTGFKKANLNGYSAYAYFQSSRDKENVINVPGTITGNIVEFTLSGNCYTNPGQAFMIARITNGTQTVSIAQLYMYIKPFDYSGIIDPENTIIDPNQFTAAFERLEADLERLEAIAPMGYAYDNLVLVQDEQPTSEDNKLWVKETASAGVQIPTKAAFIAFKEEIDGRISAIESSGTGWSDQAKVALINCFEHAIWDNGNGETYINALKEALGVLDVDITIPGGGSTPPSMPEEIIPGL